MQIQETNLKFGQLKNRQITKRIILHHSASGDVPAAEIHRWHVNQGWSGIGYHFVIRQNGSIERGRPENTIGAHSGEAGNADSIAIVLTGNLETGKPTSAQINSLVLLIKNLQTKYGQLAIIGHKDVVATACPGRNFPWQELKSRLEGKQVDSTIKVVVAGREVPGKIIENSTWVPIREYTEALASGLVESIQWHGDEKKVIVIGQK